MDDAIKLPFNVPEGWRTARLATQCEFVRDGDWIESKDQGGDDFRLLQISNIGVGRFVETGNYRWITRETFDRLGCTEILPGDVLVARMPEPTGRAWHVATLPWKSVTAVDVAIIRTNPDELDAGFLGYFLNSPACLEVVQSLTTGTTRLRIRRADIERLEVPLPERNEQLAISRILGALDEKIELNRRMSETLETVARTLFKSWFVHFDPVRAKVEGRDTALPKPVADIFPARFVDSERGEIPEGWQVKHIGDLAEVVGGGTPKTECAEYWEDGTHHWATPKDLSRLSVPVLVDTERRISDAGLAQISSGLLPQGTVLLSSRAPIGYLAIAEVPVAVNQGFIALKSRDETSNLFLLRWASAAHDEIVSYANGSTFLEINKSSFRLIRTVAPSASVMKAFDRLSRPMYSKVVEHERESRAIADLRNALLPRLISGALRVPDAERIVGKAL